MGSIKDLTEAEDIKKRWQEYTEELYKNDLHDPDNHHGVITDLEPDILAPRGNPACRGTFGGRRKAVRAGLATRFIHDILANPRGSLKSPS